VPFTGSDADASSLAMSKPVTKAVYRAHGIPVADDWLITRAEWRADPSGTLAALRRRFSPPWVLKTPRLGSSVGLNIVPAEGDLEGEVARLVALDRTLLVEAFVAGRELTCGVLDAAPFGPLRALPVLEITPVESGFFDYHAKYTPGAAREVCPAPIPEPIRDRIQALGVAAHRALGCRGFSRTDFIWDGGDRIVTLETNTIPGLTRTSLLPQQAAAAGLSFADLVSGMVLGALSEGGAPREGTQ
jgi:D-alanine-D-alanine ligase